MENKEENPTHSEAPSGSDSTGFIKGMTKEERKKLLLCEEESIAGYLDFHIDRRSDGSIHLNQKGLIQNNLDDVHLNKYAVTSPSTNYLPIDLLGEKTHVDFNYTSINDQLNHVQGNSRPNISLAASQTSRYVHNPKWFHELALIRIGRYLKGTAEKGIIFRPSISTDGTFKPNIFVDASFADGWGTELGTNPEIIEVANNPVLWIFKMQSTIETSTMEAEYTTLSMTLRATIHWNLVIMLLDQHYIH